MAVWRLPVEITYTDPGQPGANIWHFRTGGPDLESAQVDAAVEAIQAFYERLSGGGTGQPFATGTKFNAYVATEVLTGFQREVDFDQTLCSPIGGDAPPATALVCGWKTSTIGRHARGRTFLGPIAAAAVDAAGAPRAEVREALATSAAALVSDSGEDAGWAVGIYGKQTKGAVEPAPRVLRDITAAVIPTKFAVLRSRRD
jgi:hypothetical protein